MEILKDLNKLYSDEYMLISAINFISRIHQLDFILWLNEKKRNNEMKICKKIHIRTKSKTVFHNAKIYLPNISSSDVIP